MKIDLSGKVALVTGAGRGIGRAIAEALAEAGASVVVNYRGSQSAAEEVVEGIKQRGGRALALQADVALAEEGERLVKATVESFGRLDILVNNAGITRDNLLLRMKEEEIDAVLNTNLRAAMLISKAVLRPMMKNRWGRVITISSVVGLTGNAGQANYAAAKAGVIGFTKTLAQEMASRGITANVVAPGFVETDMSSGLSDEVRKAATDRIPLGRMGSVGDIAPAVVFLASEAAGYITGQTLAVDGGMTMY